VQPGQTQPVFVTLRRGVRNLLYMILSKNIKCLYQVGINFFESSCCWLDDSGNAAIPAMIAATMNRMETIDQITPQHCEDPPYLWAKTLASEVFTFRRMRSSHCVLVSKGKLSRVMKEPYNIPDGVEGRHDTNKELLRTLLTDFSGAFGMGQLLTTTNLNASA